MLVPIVVFVACFGVGIVASARWLPDLGPGTVAGTAFLLVSGLLGAALGLSGLGIYSIIREIDAIGGTITNGGGTTSGEVLAEGLRSILVEAGTLVGLAGIVYLLAPPGPDDPAAGEPAVSLAEADA